MAEQILRLLEIKRVTGWSSSSIYRAISKGEFPKQIKIGQRSSGWLKSEVDQWLADRVAASRKGEV